MHVTYREELNKWESKHEHKVRELTRQKDKLAMENMELMKAADKKDAELGALRRSHEHQISVYQGLLAKSQNGLTDDMFEKAAAAGGGGGPKRKDMMLGGAPEKGEEAKKSKVRARANAGARGGARQAACQACLARAEREEGASGRANGLLLSRERGGREDARTASSLLLARERSGTEDARAASFSRASGAGGRTREQPPASFSRASGAGRRAREQPPASFSCARARTASFSCARFARLALASLARDQPPPLALAYPVTNSLQVQKEAENPGRHRLGYYNSDEDDSDDSIEIQPRRDKPVVVAKQSGLSKHTASAIASARPFAAKKKSGVSGSKFNSLLGGSGKGAGNPLFAQRDRLKENSAPKGGKGGVIKQPRFEVAKPKGGGMKTFLKPSGKRTLY
jgi:hypothetical protein